jgi:hypothetical protein
MLAPPGRVEEDDSFFPFPDRQLEQSPTHKETFNNTLFLISKMKNPRWDRFSCERSIARTLFAEKNNDGYNVCIGPQRKQCSI